MEFNGDPPPLWPQLTTSMPRRRRRSSSSSSLLLNPPLLIIILPIIALFILFFAVPSFFSITSQIVRPNSVKKSWDSPIVVLVLFAVFCGIFARGNDDGSSADEDNTAATNNFSRDAGDYKPNSVSQQWFDQYSGDDHHRNKIYDSAPIRRSVTGTGRLKRSSSSYPDLRQDSLWETGDERFRFFDDFEIHKYGSGSPLARTTSDHYVQLRRRRSELEEPEAKVIQVDTFVFRSSPPPASPAPPPPPPPPPATVHHKPRWAYQSMRNNKVKEEKKRDVSDSEFTKIETSPPIPPPPPPPPVQTTYRSEQKNCKSERRKSNATKEIKMVLASLYNQRKRKKKQRTKNTNSYDHDHDHHLHSPLPESSPYNYSTIPPPSTRPPPPPPPPLPPPPSVFYGLFKKANKSKKVHSVPAPPPPPPSSSNKKTKIPKPLSPPPPPSTPPPEPSRRRNPATTGRRPPLPTRVSNNYDENVNRGNQSPLIPMPPPPPPPSFRMAEMKFAVRGDFVKIRSSHSSRCSSPELDDVYVLSSKKESEMVSVMDGDDGVGTCGGPVFCPSPDVNVKAETFIARLRDGWKLEKMNSMREKRKIGHS